LNNTDWEAALLGLDKAQKIQSCQSDLEMKGIFVVESTKVEPTKAELRFADIRDYLIFVLMRSPKLRFMSMLKTVLSGFEGTFEELLSRSDPTCAFCQVQRAHSVHWQPQYSAMMESGLARIDDIICTEEIDILLEMPCENRGTSLLIN